MSGGVAFDYSISARAVKTEVARKHVTLVLEASFSHEHSLDNILFLSDTFVVESLRGACTIHGGRIYKAFKKASDCR